MTADQQLADLKKRVTAIEDLLTCLRLLPEQVGVVESKVNFMADALSDVVATSPLPERPLSAHERAAALGWEQSS